MQICVLIISVINAALTADSYNEIRSGFSEHERCTQTLETIQSIRERVPQAQIVLIEGGGETSLLNQLKGAVDCFVFVGNSEIVRRFVDGRHKSLGECVLSLIAIPSLLKCNAEFIFKISGRYRLNDNFSIANWDTKEFNFLHIKKDNVSTRFYGFPKRKLLRWIALVASASTRALKWTNSLRQVHGKDN
jgi:hypothetical protein